MKNYNRLSKIPCGNRNQLSRCKCLTNFDFKNLRWDNNLRSRLPLATKSTVTPNEPNLSGRAVRLDEGLPTPAAIEGNVYALSNTAFTMILFASVN